LFNLKHNYQKNPKIMFKNESLFVILIDWETILNSKQNNGIGMKP
jgi:hypothetical protein